MSCRHVREWLHREASSLDEAQRLQLDDHLASCEACRGDRARMQLVHHAGTSLDAPAESRMYDRAIARALLGASSAHAAREAGASSAHTWRETPRGRSRRARWLWPIAIGMAAAATIGAWITMRDEGDSAHDSVASDPKSHDLAPVRDDLAPVRDDLAPVRDDLAPARDDLASRDPSTAPDPNGDSSARDNDDLATAPVEIRVERAVVVTVAASTTIAHGVQTQVVIAASSIADVVPIERDELTPIPRGSNAALEPVAEILARARAQLAKKQLADAERTASSVLPRVSGADEAEARTILADIAQASGNHDLASTLYREVAAKFASLPAGESALYAAARLDVRRGRDARALLEQYLDRYPRGRFVDDARRLLGATPKEQR
jgi:hypothetical protein